jgi:peroxiredoxin
VPGAKEPIHGNSGIRQSRRGLPLLPRHGCIVKAAPKPGEPMPPFAMPDEQGHLVTLDALLAEGPLAMTFHRGLRINIRAFAEAQERIASNGANLAAIMPDRQCFAALFKAEGEVRYPVLTDIDNGYALSLNLATWVGDEMQKILESGGRQLPDYQGNNAWVLPIPATFVIAKDGTITARFIDLDFRKRVAIKDLLKALQDAQSQGEAGRKA